MTITDQLAMRKMIRNVYNLLPVTVDIKEFPSDMEHWGLTEREFKTASFLSQAYTALADIPQEMDR